MLLEVGDGDQSAAELGFGVPSEVIDVAQAQAGQTGLGEDDLVLFKCVDGAVWVGSFTHQEVDAGEAVNGICRLLSCDGGGEGKEAGEGEGSTDHG